MKLERIDKYAGSWLDLTIKAMEWDTVCRKSDTSKTGVESQMQGSDRHHCAAVCAYTQRNLSQAERGSLRCEGNL